MPIELKNYECFGCGSEVIRPSAEADDASCPFCDSNKRGLVTPFGGAEWLECDTPYVLRQVLTVLGRAPSTRQARLARCEVCRRLYVPAEATLLEVLDLAAEHADGRVTDAALLAAEERLLHNRHESDWVQPVWWRNALACVVDDAHDFEWAGDNIDSGLPAVAAKSVTAECYRDIFGNPFRPVTFSASWRTDTVVILAKRMYDSRDFGVMPILADALQDAGCNNEDVLRHCRDCNQVHVRGCWVIDLVLGKD